MHTTKIFVNLPVKDLQRSIDFFTKLGFKFNQQFTDETATCMIISEDIYTMLITEPRFKDFTNKPVSDAKTSTEVLVGLSMESREAVGEIVKKAVAAGGKTFADPQDHGFMLQHSFEDPDGHIWEVFYMDPSFVQPQG